MLSVSLFGFGWFGSCFNLGALGFGWVLFSEFGGSYGDFVVSLGNFGGLEELVFTTSLVAEKVK